MYKRQGVNRAVELTYGLLAEGHKVATLGPLIHNPQAVEDMRLSLIHILCLLAVTAPPACS